MKILTALVAILFVVLQYKLWFTPGGVPDVMQLKEQLQAQVTINNKLKGRNQALAAEIQNLKRGKNAIEERARNDLGLVKGDEVFYQIVTKK